MSESSEKRSAPLRPDPDPIATTVRKQVQARRLPPGAACALCGKRNLKSSAWKRSPRICWRCTTSPDRRMTRRCSFRSVSTATSRPPPFSAMSERSPRVNALVPRSYGPGSALAGLVFELLADAEYRWATQLDQICRLLDEKVPGWRDVPGMS